MKYRNLRIAWSVAWGLAAVLLIALWVRSYWWVDMIWRYTPAGGTRVVSGYGKIWFQCVSVTGKVANVVVGSKSDRTSLPTAEAFFGMKFYAGFLLRRLPNDITLFVPHWFLPLFAITTATVPWFRWRFTLRTLLIATALIAIVLGLLAFYIRW